MLTFLNVSCALPVFDGSNIFLDSLAYGWSDFSFSCTTNLAALDRVFQGSKSISISPAAFGAFRVFYNPSKYPNPVVMTSDVDVVEFMLQTSSTTVPPARLSIETTQGVQLISVLPTIVANTWTRVRVSMGAIEPNNVSIRSLMLKSTSSTNEKFWIDDLKFVLKTTTSVAAPPTTTSTATTSTSTSRTSVTSSASGTTTASSIVGGSTAQSTASSTVQVVAQTTTTAAPTSRSVAATSTAPTTGSSSWLTPAPPAPCSPPVPAEVPAFPVKLECCPDMPTRKTLRFTLNTDFSSFDSVLWIYELAASRKSDPKLFKICNIRRGSVILDVDGPSDVQTSVEADFRNGVLFGVPNVTSISDSRSTATSSNDVPIIIGAVVGCVVLLAVIVLVVVLLRRRTSSYTFSSSTNYISLVEK